MGRTGKAVSRQDQRGGEIRQGGREKEKKGVGQPRNGERQRHGPEDPPAGASQTEGHVLHVGVDAGEDRFQGQIGDREKGDRFGEEGAVEPVNDEPFDPEEIVGDQPPRPEGEDHGDGGREGGRDRGAG